MKKLILTTMAVCAVGFSAVAQNTDNGSPDEGSNQVMQGSDQTPQDQGALAQPSDQVPPDQQQPPDQNASGQQPDQGAPAQPSDQGQPVVNEPAPPANESVPSVQFVAPTQGGDQQFQRHRHQRQRGASDNSMADQAMLPPPAGATNAGPDELRLNFDNVPLQEVLSYLSDAAGFIIVMDTQVHGTVSVISSHPMTSDEAVDLLNSVLNANGYAAIRDGRTLTIMNKDDAKTANIPVQVGNNPDSIPKNDVIVTQIIPVKYVDASQLVSDLASFVSPQAIIVANQAGNSIVITDTQENIRHLVEIVSAIDSSAAGETEIRVFPLQFANPNDVANELGQIFPSGGSGNGFSPIAFRGGGGGPGGGGGGGGFFARMAAAAAANGGNRAQKQSQVTAVADSRTQSVIVMASKDLMLEITGMMEQLDVPSSRDQKVYAYTVNNADPEQVLQVLQSTFPTSSTSGRSSSSSSSQTETSPLITRQVEGATEAGQTTGSIQSGTGTGAGAGRAGGSGTAP